MLHQRNGGAVLIWFMLRLCNNCPERQEITPALLRNSHSAVGEEAVTDDLCLLLEPVAVEALAVPKLITVTAKWMTHQRQIIFAMFLRLPDMGHFVDEQPLQRQWFGGEIVRPARVGGMEMDVAGRSHDDAPGLERKPSAAHDTHPRIIDRRPEDRAGEGDFAIG